MRTLQRRLVRVAAAADSEIMLLEELDTGGHSPRWEAVLQKLKSFTFVFVFVIAALGLTISSARAAILTVDGSGQLTGATNVDLGSLLGFFNVSFVDGTCIDLFTGCDAVSDFDFDNPTDASTAAQALLDQVFFDTPPSQLFDTDPSLTFGCNAAPCQTLIPHGFADADNISLVLALAINYITEASDFKTTGSILSTTDTATFDAVIFANFSPVSTVPLPPAALLFVSALVGLVGFARRRRQA